MLSVSMAQACVESSHVIMKELEMEIAEIEGNGAEEKAKDLQSDKEIVPVSIQQQCLRPTSQLRHKDLPVKGH